MKALLKELTGTAGPPGYEEAVRAVIRREVEPLADELRVDALGSLIARKGAATGKPGGRRIMVTAQMDESGLMASHIEAQGAVRFAALGPLDRRTLAGSRVRFLNGQGGLVGCERTEDSALPGLDKFFLDVGATSRANCPVETGEIAVLEAPFMELGETAAAKALNSRAPVLAAVETLRALNSTPHEVYFVFTAREQVNANALAACSHALAPDIVLTLGVTPAGEAGSHDPEGIRLESGPAIMIRDGYALADPRIVEWMTREAERKRMPVQREVGGEGSPNAVALQIGGGGPLWGGLSIPLRYLHSPSEMIDMQDLENTIRLLGALLRLPLRLEA